MLGKTVPWGEVPLTLVGVASREFLGFVVGGRPDLWWPVPMVPQVQAWNDALTEGGSQWLQIAGRLNPDLTEAQARDEVDVVFKRMLLLEVEKGQFSEKERQKSLSRRIELRSAGTGFSWLRREFQRLLFILMAIVGAVLLVACTNLAGLLLARGAARQREFSVRAALGAGRLVLVRQLVTESLLLAALGGLLGLLLAPWGVWLLASYIRGYGETAQLQLTPDLTILGFTFLVSVGTGLLFGFLPAWHSSRQDVAVALKDQAGNVVGRPWGQFWNKALMVAQIALSCCLLIGAGLFVRTVQKLRALDVGFDRENLMVFDLNLGRGYDDGVRRGTLHEEILRRLRSLPTVRAASMSSLQSLGGSEIGVGMNKVAVMGTEAVAGGGLDVRGTAVSLGYFQTLGIPLLMGRDFGPQDELTVSSSRPSQPARPAIIDQTIARKLFGQENPVGRLLRTSGWSSWPYLEVIGIAGDAIHKGLRSGPRITVYILETSRDRHLEFFHVRTTGSPLAVAGSIRQIVHELDPQVEVTGLQTADDLVNDQWQRERMLSPRAGFFRRTALALACLGLYGTLS